MFEWERGTALTQQDFDIEHKKMYLTEFLYEGSITLFFSKAKQGKTWLAYGLANFLGYRVDVKKVYYVDGDNPIAVLKDRKIDELLMFHEKLDYISRGSMRATPMDLVKDMQKEAKRGAYDKCVFIFDTTKDFIDTDSSSQAREFMRAMIDIRDAGATVIILHHATKSGSTISGDKEFTTSPDVVYELKQKAKTDNTIHFTLGVVNDRYVVKDCGFSLDTTTLMLTELDSVFASMSEYDEKFVNKGIEALKKNPDGLNKSSLLAAIGYKKDDKTAQDTLTRYADIFWEVDKQNTRVHIYKLK